MHIILVSLLLVAPGAVIWVWPPGTEVYLGESVVLQCNVSTAAAAATYTRVPQWRWSYRWFRHQLHQAPPVLDPPRHLASRDTYAITGATAEDGGSYWCQAEGPGPGDNSSTVLLLSERVQLNVSGTLPPLLSLTPSSLQFFRGDNLTVHCPGSVSNQTAWRLRQLSQDFGVITWDLQAGLCSPLAGRISSEHSNACLFAGLSRGNSGLYWCESETRRSNAVPITVITNDTIILKSPYLVSEGDQVILHCQFWNGNQRMATFFKDGLEVATQSSARPEEIIGMAIENVTKAQEGFYKCASQDRTMESPESWLSVKFSFVLGCIVQIACLPFHETSPFPDSGIWKWSITSSVAVVLLFSIVLIVWLVHRRWGKRSRRDCGWPGFKAGVANVDVPKTKQDVTEVQWDLSWMEMSNLLDKQ
ncbi:unnamed protein product [Lota lota]